MPAATDFADRGARLWRALHARGVKHDPATDVLIEEACRIADRLDKLHRILDGTDAEWLRLDGFDSGTEIVVGVDHVLTEARQQATALRGLLAPLQKMTPAVAAPAKKASAVDEVGQQRRLRRAAATGR